MALRISAELCFYAWERKNRGKLKRRTNKTTIGLRVVPFEKHSQFGVYLEAIQLRHLISELSISINIDFVHWLICIRIKIAHSKARCLNVNYQVLRTSMMNSHQKNTVNLRCGHKRTILHVVLKGTQ